MNLCRAMLVRAILLKRSTQAALTNPITIQYRNNYRRGKPHYWIASIVSHLYVLSEGCIQETQWSEFPSSKLLFLTFVIQFCHKMQQKARHIICACCRYLRSYGPHTISQNPPRRSLRRWQRTVKMATAYLTHQQKVLRLYKKSLRHLESWCIFR